MKKILTIILFCMLSVASFAQKQQMNNFTAVGYSHKMINSPTWSQTKKNSIRVEMKAWSGSYIKIGNDVIPARQVSKNNNFTDDAIIDVWACYPKGEGGPSFQSRFFMYDNGKYQLYLD